MKFQKFKKRSVVIVCVSALFMLASLSVLARAGSFVNNSVKQRIPSYATNESGLTYGSSADATYDTMPDLISAFGMDGTKGYVYAKDLLSNLPQTEDKTDEMLQSCDNWIPIPLYKLDGVTRIGTFVIGPAAITYYYGEAGQRDELLPPSFPVNASGQTYGSAANTTPLTEPDLISAIGEKGESGYVYASAFYKQGSESYYFVPLYEVDGKTIIGQFMIQSGKE